MIVPMKPNEPIAWNIQRVTRRAVRENALASATANVVLSLEDWDELCAIFEHRVTYPGSAGFGRFGEKLDLNHDPNRTFCIYMHAAGRRLNVFCDPKQERGTIDIELTAELSPEVFA